MPPDDPRLLELLEAYKGKRLLDENINYEILDVNLATRGKNSYWVAQCVEVEQLENKE